MMGGGGDASMGYISLQAGVAADLVPRGYGPPGPIPLADLVPLGPYPLADLVPQADQIC